MATGITKREQFGSDATLAEDYLLEEFPLPSDNEKIEISYSNKMPESMVLRHNKTDYNLMDDNGQVIEKINAIPEDSFVLTDNFLGLHSLLNSNKKVTLFYLDPPYGTGFDFHSRDLEHAYKDSMGSATYLEFMRRRLILMRECMSDDGSIYVHIGYQMLAHLKIIMDEIFGSKNFKNIITRRKCSSKNFTQKQYANINDYILFYTKSNKYKWNKPSEIPEQDWIEKEYPKIDNYGRRFKLVPIHAPGTRNGETGKEWRGKLPPRGKHWQYSPAKLEELDKKGDIHWSRNGNPRRKVFWSEDKRILLTDYWKNFRDAHHQSIKITGYPTEKNFEMIKLIITASSDPGDLVVDPFCGSGTTLEAAKELNRKFVGMDASFTAAKTTINRIRHGTKSMGDFVNVKAEELNLFKPPKNADVKFIVEKKLFPEHSKEIKNIAKI